MNDYTRTAVAILEKLKGEVGPALLAFWVTPNTILALSGVRAYCDGVNWSDDEAQLTSWEAEIARSYAALRKYADVFDGELQTEEVRPRETFTGYELVFRPGLRKVLSGTRIVAEGEKLIDKASDMRSLMDVLKAAVKANPSYAGLDDENLNHIAFGILVGYPDAAIIGNTLEQNPRDNPFVERSINADIRGADYYACPQPVYSYPRHLVTDPVITAHEKLWSSILEEYYTSDFHKQLEADKAFNDKLEELGMTY